nr:M43 family zinc metalloprotease [Bacteroidia bacterium]
MKNLYAILSALAFLLPMSLMAQTAAVQHEKCLAHHYYQQMMNNDPAFRAAQQQLEQETQSYANQQVANRNAGSGQKNSSVVRVIPVVFHVIHEGGTENISRAQCLDQLDSLNKDYRRLNADAANTPAPFQPIGGDAEIEFRIASLDPNGNCTDGVVRVFSPLTTEARNNVKALSYWPSNKYLNIWVVKSIENTNGTAGTVLGFAQFPGGIATTDGVVMRSDVIGSIGTAFNTVWNNNGRTATHEIGHWLNLRHIWGDANCGSDFVTDTPTQQGPNAGCPAFPHVTCNNGPNGDMFTNYMDYTDGSCQNIFSSGQCTRMNAALSSAVSGRSNLWSSANLIATGTTGAPGAVCAPIAAFVNNTHYICEGTIINFTDGSWNGTPDTWSWDFHGGTPATSSSQNPSIQYNTAGVYDVTLTVTNVSGTDSYT